MCQTPRVVISTHSIEKMVNAIDHNLHRYLEWLFSHSTDHSLMVLLVDQTTSDWDRALLGWLLDLYWQIRNLEFSRVRNRFGFFLQEHSMAQLQFIMRDVSSQSAVQLNNELRAAMRETSERTHDDYTAAGNIKPDVD